VGKSFVGLLDGRPCLEKGRTQKRPKPSTLFVSATFLVMEDLVMKQEQNRGRILIVEDELIIAQDLEIVLKDKGFDVIGCVSDLKEAIAESRSAAPDLVLMDISLWLDFQWITIADTIWNDLGIPVVYLTAYSERVLKTLMPLPHARYFVPKPCSEEELCSMIDAALQNKGCAKE
jgi:DNA-binding response OmpR family regulator